MFNLNSKKILITGGSKGIGAACVKYFCMAGASVAFTYNSNSSMTLRVEKRFEKISKFKAYKVDIKNEDEKKNINLKKISKKSKKNMCAKENQNLFSCFLLFHIMPCTSFLKLRDDVKDGLSLFYFILFFSLLLKDSHFINFKLTRERVSEIRAAC